jgi:hypothetical protein
MATRPRRGGPPGAWGPPTALPPRRPGQVVTSAVLAFVQAGLVVFASLYVLLLSSVLDMAAEQPAFPGGARGFAAEADVLAVLQFGSAALLIAVGILALNRRTRLAWVLLLVGHGVQIALTVYWMVRLGAFFGAIPGPDPGGALVGLGLFFAAVPLIGAGLVVIGPGRRWFDGGARA